MIIAKQLLLNFLNFNDSKRGCAKDPFLTLK